VRVRCTFFNALIHRKSILVSQTLLDVEAIVRQHGAHLASALGSGRPPVNDPSKGSANPFSYAFNFPPPPLELGGDPGFVVEV
jgi:hypothetical protein